MATLKEYYKKDFSRYFGFHTTWIGQEPSGEKFDIIAQVHCDFESNTKFVSFYVPKVTNPLKLFIELLVKIEEALKIMDKNVEVKTCVPGGKEINNSELKFSGRVYIYYADLVDNKEITELEEAVLRDGLYLHFRDASYLSEKLKYEKPLAFISHDSRDKVEYAGKIAIGLQKLMCPVWYDEYSLKVGDSLRESIEKGLKECKKCILILSPNFLNNQGWTSVEFNTIFTREILETKKLVLPIWCNVTKAELFQYSPTLVDRVGVNWDKGIDDVVRKLYNSIMTKER